MILNSAWGIVRAAVVGTRVLTFVVEASLIWWTSRVFETDEDARVTLIVVAKAVRLMTDDLASLARITRGACTRALTFVADASKIVCAVVVASAFKRLSRGTSELRPLIDNQSILAYTNGFMILDFTAMIVCAGYSTTVLPWVPAARILTSSDRIIASQVSGTVLIDEATSGQIRTHRPRNGIATVLIANAHFQWIPDVALGTGTLGFMIYYTAHSILSTDVSKTTWIYALSSNASLVTWTALIRGALALLYTRHIGVTAGSWWAFADV